MFTLIQLSGDMDKYDSADFIPEIIQRKLDAGTGLPSHLRIEKDWDGILPPSLEYRNGPLVIERTSAFDEPDIVAAYNELLKSRTAIPYDTVVVTTAGIHALGPVLRPDVTLNINLDIINPIDLLNSVEMSDTFREDAERYRALQNYGTIRMIGSAGFHNRDEYIKNDHYYHFGAEFWSTGREDSKYADHDGANEYLDTYTDVLIQNARDGMDGRTKKGLK